MANTGAGPGRANRSSKNKKVGMVFGSFDPLHYGHIRLLKRAKRRCDYLVAITEDNEIIEEKHPPFTTSEQRLDDLLGIKYVDAAFIRSKKRNREYYVKRIRPNVLFLGSDWKDKRWEGEKLGVKIEYLPRTEGISSTKLRNGLGIS